jgi:hypothetical protein
MPIKIENKTTIKLPKNTQRIVESALDTVPVEHLRGLNRIVLVDQITPDSRLALPSISELPGLYHPRIGRDQPWIEIALRVLLPGKGFFKRLAARLNYKANLAGVIFSLQAQHYYLTLSHGIKKHQYESAIRSYMEKYHEIWREKQGGFRARLFKPLRPYLDKWARKLRTRYEAEQKRRQPS